ncbi:MAG TPA: flagellar basal body P-ring protein FlgI [Rhodocyclaceae bacterium]|nr:flagellar basal body P-ring protein FlgI [Rhodocyclaceae bacterium]
MIVMLGTLSALLSGDFCDASVRLKDIGRFSNSRDTQLIGYGVVMGLAGTGDSSRSRATSQSISNLLSHFDVVVPRDQIQSRNVAVVMVTASAPGSSRSGDKVDVTVSSMGDAKSLVGGTLLLTPLKSADGALHAVAQGALSVGGYRYDANGNVVQKNHPTTALVADGAMIEGALSDAVDTQHNLTYVLRQPDLATAHRVANAISSRFPGMDVAVRSESAVDISLKNGEALSDSGNLADQIELLMVEPDAPARVVVNERTGTVVAGGDVRISNVVVTHGDLKVSVVTDPVVSQPDNLIATSPGIRTIVTHQTRVDVAEPVTDGVVEARNTVSDLVMALNRIKTSPRDTIAILQGIKAAGALYADLIVQ